MNNPNQLHCIALAAAIACTAPAVMAQSVTEKPVGVTAGVLPPVLVVGATKKSIDVSDAPAAVSVIERRDLDQRNITRPADALKTVPSLYTGSQADGQVNRSSGGTGAVTLRGIPGARTLVLLDGQSVLGANSGSINWRLVNVDELERIEVIPGSFSSLYGSGAVGGVIDMVTKKPDRDEFVARWKHGFGDAAGDDTSVFFRQHFNNGLGIMASASRIRRDDYRSDAVVVSPVAGAGGTSVTGAVPTTTVTGLPAYVVGYKGASPWQQDNASVKLTYDLDARSRLYAGYMRSDFSESRLPYESWLRNASGNGVTSGTLGINGQKVTLLESAFVNTQSAQATQRYFAGYDGMWGSETQLKVNLARIADEPSARVVTSSSAVANGPGRQSLTPTEVSDAQVQISRPLGERKFLVSGIALQTAQVSQRHWGLSNWNDASSRTGLNEGYDGQSRTLALFGQFEWQPIDPLTLYLGGRWDDWRTSGSYFRTTPAPAINAVYAERNESAFSPKVSAVYKPVENLTLRTSLGQSFLAPGNLDLYARSFHGPNVFLNDPTLKPERGTSWEIGGEMQVSPQAKAGVTYFDSKLTDMIILKQLSQFTRQYVNIGEAKVRGVELTGKVQVTPAVRLDANYSWIDASTVRNDADLPSVGKRITAVPDALAYLGLSANSGAWTGTFDLRYTGKVFGNTDNSDTAQNVRGAYDAYVWANARIGYQFTRNVQLQLSVNNLTDRQVYQSIRLPSRTWSTELVFKL
jgi:iron complex outermembrane receptor protein